MADVFKSFFAWMNTLPFWQIIVGGYIILFCTLLLNFADYKMPRRQKFFRSGWLSALLMLVIIVASFASIRVA